MEMLRQAARKAPDITWVQADAATLPFPDRSFDIASCQFAFHHFQGKARMLREAFRVLGVGGRFVLRNSCPQESSDWLYYEYFPEAEFRDLRDFWPPDALMAVYGRGRFYAGDGAIRASSLRAEPARLARDRAAARHLLAAAVDFGRGLRGGCTPLGAGTGGRQRAGDAFRSSVPGHHSRRQPNGGHLSAPRRWMPAEELPHRPFYDGATLHVRSYDSMNSGDRPVRRGDVSFYLDLARRAGGEVLEIGVGTGRVALQLAKAGVRVTGLDLSPDMLAIAAEKAAASRLVERLRLERGDMRNFDLATRDFGLVIVPYRAFQILLTPEDQFAALAAFRRHLRKGGILALHLFDPDLRFLLPGATGPVDRARCVDRSTGRTVEAVLETALFDHVNQTRRDLWRYRTFAPDGTIAEEEALELSIRWSFRWEMRHLLQFAGFAVEAEFSDFLGSPPAYGKEQIWVARNS